MANEIHISVVDREIKVGRHVPATMTNIGRDFLSISLDDEWNDQNSNIRVTFYSEAPYVSVQDWWDGQSAIEIPHEITMCPAFKITVAQVSKDGRERLVTQAMDEPIENPRNGHDEGAEPSPATLDVVRRIDALAADLEEKRNTDYWRGEPGKDADIAGAEAAKNAANKAAEDAVAAAARADNAAINANNSVIKTDEAATNADTATTNANAAAANAESKAAIATAAAANASEKASIATSKAVEAESAATLANEAATNADTATMNANAAATEAHGAATLANEAADNANETANQIKQRADYGEFNGSDGYSPTVNVTKVGGTATITVTDKNGTTTATVSDGAPGSDAQSTDVRVKGISITENGIANIPPASYDKLGVVMNGAGIDISTSGVINPKPLMQNMITNRKAGFTYNNNSNDRCAITPSRLDYAVKAAMCDGKGAAWTDEEKLAARKRLGIGNYELIDSLVLEQDVSSIIREKTYNGRRYSFSMIIIDVIMNGVSSPESINLFIKLNDKYNTESVPAIMSSAPNYKARVFEDVSHGFLDARFAAKTYNSTSNANPYQMLQVYTYSAIDKITNIGIVAANNKLIPAGIKIDIYGVWV